ncbi:MAG: sigma-54 dependent transcriptional regulator [Deltaproteobacteria bacterium]|jgi:two-component system response regulator HydG|nr:sigma-54 dependent transcriptional regulator [Deltaproteobacteria bacterium]
MAKDPILIVDDDTEHLYMLKTVIGDWGYATETARNGRDAVRMSLAAKYSLILMDVRMGNMDGLTALSVIKGEDRDKTAAGKGAKAQEAKNPNLGTPVIIMTAYSTVPDAVTAVKAGAYDYITKPLDMETLRDTIVKSLESHRVKREKRADVPVPGGDGLLIGESGSFTELLKVVEQVAPTMATVLITGESGVGKEMVARLIQAKSPRKDKPFVTINCGALSETLTESELFGHVKGAFTGAENTRDGRLKAGNGGTVFLDEIAEINLATQVKLLRTLQEGEIQPLGSDVTEKVDLRFLAATNKDLGREVLEKRFREDLFYRLNVVTLNVPPLRDRKEDILPLANYFIRMSSAKNNKAVKGLSLGAIDAIKKYHWPGNIRELQNAMERAVILSRGEDVTEKDLPLNMSLMRDKVPELPLNLEELEKIAVIKAVEKAGGNKTQAAKELGVTRKTLAAKLKNYGIED